MKGVKYIAPFRDMSGYGEASRGYILALHRAGVPLTLECRSFESSPPPVGTEEERRILTSLEGKDIDYDIVIVHLTPDLVPRYAHAHPGKYIINYTVWETSKLHPTWVKACNLSSEIFVPCQWNVEAFRNSGVKVPITKIPHGINTAAYDGVKDDFSIGGVDKSNTFVFYSIFQWNYRKNPDGLIRAYFNAFPDEADVALVLKAYIGRGLSPEQEKDQIRRWMLRLKNDMAIPSYPRLYVISSYLSGEEMRSLHKFGDAYVSMARAEGFGLGAFEAGLAGKPVIMTGMGGNMEFMSPENSYPVDYQWTYVSRMSDFNPWYLGDQKWAEPNQIHCSRLMREVYNNRKEAAAKGKLLQKNIKDNFSWDSVASLIIKRLKEIKA